MPRDLEGSVATLLPLPNRFVSTEGWRRYDFIIVGGNIRLLLYKKSGRTPDAPGAGFPFFFSFQE